ncbi:hypothetical protein BU16DRAFT_350725 [Lophium mytilinum]|uniref:Uncharacterized protein n=1 Tax=Lophium mytilinum TaxID=390894 RepID=A0A6A6QZW9_9PEZI|nr:hypothetical protein BU16DRAFT_350725 [Lophium mytilinum]
MMGTVGDRTVKGSRMKLRSGEGRKRSRTTTTSPIRNARPGGASSRTFWIARESHSRRGRRVSRQKSPSRYQAGVAATLCRFWFIAHPSRAVSFLHQQGFLTGRVTVIACGVVSGVSSCLAIRFISSLSRLLFLPRLVTFLACIGVLLMLSFPFRATVSLISTSPHVLIFSSLSLPNFASRAYLCFGRWKTVCFIPVSHLLVVLSSHIT